MLPLLISFTCDAVRSVILTRLLPNSERGFSMILETCKSTGGGRRENEELEGRGEDEM